MHFLGLSIKMQSLVHICLTCEITFLLKCYQISYNKLVVTTRWVIIVLYRHISVASQKKKIEFLL